MEHSVKVTISIPADILGEIEQGRKERRETRSAFIRAAIEHVVRERRTQGDIERYIRGYQEHPESDDEIASAEQLSRAVLAEEPWE
jgi:metal-responsive CopG/Arc/MetJ family transcriptional regulator